ncbi:hypothetical protein Y032_0175g502 [Ancylostoma ceylanicum]|uniref:Uncharacterized protein n=1 Tax=Ancylostoma ceylanicum TaxID=53326 RepID=A0A016SUY3_9BILA|nr:hypothetical protein Y032_0175g502 [Ancylostoma ceylanicum]
MNIYGVLGFKKRKHKLLFRIIKQRRSRMHISPRPSPIPTIPVREVSPAGMIGKTRMRISRDAFLKKLAHEFALER